MQAGVQVGGAVTLGQPFERLDPGGVVAGAQFPAQLQARGGGGLGQQGQVGRGQVIESVGGDGFADQGWSVLAAVDQLKERIDVLRPDAFQQHFWPGALQRVQQSFGQLGLVRVTGQATVVPGFVEQQCGVCVICGALVYRPEGDEAGQSPRASTHHQFQGAGYDLSLKARDGPLHQLANPLQVWLAQVAQALLELGFQ
ncbi:hypothetical protein D3C80_1133990 [compost metagenome]